MTFKYNNVYINEVSTITGPYEAKGLLGSYFDKSYDEFYFSKKTWEEAESKILEDSVDLLLNKLSKTKFDIDLFISGDLLNQITASSFAANNLKIPYSLENVIPNPIECQRMEKKLKEKLNKENRIC